LHKYITSEGERRVSVSDRGKPACTIFRSIRKIKNYSLLEAELKTGRTHQLRVQLAHLGYPILGDEKYGDFSLNKQFAKQGLKRMFLHAAKLGFQHPSTGTALHLEAPLPAELQALLRRLSEGEETTDETS
jgi:23S rRNA pseudouridine955/2504/2580 synthase